MDGRDGEPGVGVANLLDTMLGYQLRRASSAMLADLTRSLAHLGLRVAEASAILLIEANPDITQSEIGRALGIQRANMAPLATALTDRGIIARTRFDGRSQALRLGAEGLALAAEIRARIATHDAAFLPDLSPAERAALIELLKRVWVGSAC